MLVKTLLVFVCVSVTASASGRHPFFRRDYTYIDQFNAFFKLHLTSAGDSWSSAFEACNDEGSVLFYPKSKDEWTVVKTLAAVAKVKSNVSSVLVGIHDESGMGEFITVEGLPTPLPLFDEYPASDGAHLCVIMDVDSGAYSVADCQINVQKPFVCKRVESVLPSCPTIDHEYTVHQEINKCYKVNNRYKTWTEAMYTCFMEGGHLAVITNSIEANIIKSKLQDGEAFIGFHRLSPGGDFYTVNGQKFDDVFYQNWWNNREENTKEDCGVAVQSSYKDLYTITRNCQRPAPFVCEMVPV